MKTITLYKAYAQCRNEMENCVSARGDRDNGIAVEDDRLAHQWQRTRRLAIKLQERILQRLGDIE